MAVIIKGLKMPKGCVESLHKKDSPLKYGEYRCCRFHIVKSKEYTTSCYCGAIFNKLVDRSAIDGGDFKYLNKRPKWCPLKEVKIAVHKLSKEKIK